MRIFNRIILILALFGLYALGLYAAFYGFNIAGYSSEAAQNNPILTAISGSLPGFVSDIEDGPAPGMVAWLVLTVLIGLVLLVLELKPRRPRRVRLQQGIFMTRQAVRDQATAAAESADEVLQSSARVKARRRPGAIVNVTAHVRRGEDLRPLRNAIQEHVQQSLARTGTPTSRVRVSLLESDPRQETRARVR